MRSLARLFSRKESAVSSGLAVSAAATEWQLADSWRKPIPWVEGLPTRLPMANFKCLDDQPALPPDSIINTEETSASGLMSPSCDRMPEGESPLSLWKSLIICIWS
jgi:hypothetical protein